MTIVRAFVLFWAFINGALGYQIYPLVSENIRYLVEVGDQVAKGELLIEFDDRQITAEIAQQQAILGIKQLILDDKKLELSQARTLYDRLVKPKREVELAEIAFKTAQFDVQLQQAKLAQSVAKLAKHKIYAPFKATVLDIPNRRNASNHLHPQVLMVLQKSKQSK